jgi:tRNA pseudouridine38-40 synthase
MPRFKLTIEYAGTRYSGWQVQKNARTIAGEIERAVETAAGRRAHELYGSGRTDAGVHALAQVAHLDLATSLDPRALALRLNEALPADIVVTRCEKADHRFHARHSAVGRSYLYQIARRKTAFAKPFVWWVRERLDPARMRAAGAALTGFHDFRAFTDADPDEGSTTVALEGLTIVEHGDLVLVRVEGSHFLWRMVRRMVGVLVLAGTGDLDPGEVADLLRGPSDLPARATAPASGLFLERVFYPGDSREHPLGPAIWRSGPSRSGG